MTEHEDEDEDDYDGDQSMSTPPSLSSHAQPGSPQECDAECLILPLFSSEEPGGSAAEVDRALDGLIAAMRSNGEFRGELYDTAVLPTLGRLRAPRVLLLGLGTRKEFGLPGWRRA